MTETTQPQEIYDVAYALGSPLNAPELSRIYHVSYYLSEDSDYQASLGYFTSEQAAKIALANVACETLWDEWLDSPWNKDLPDEYLLSENEHKSRLAEWVKTTPLDDIIENWVFSDDYTIDAIDISKTPILGEIKP